jgi:hypothetical protein
MTGRTKGRLALLVLVALVVAGAATLATTSSTRVRFWSWRMRSSDRAAREHARVRLLEIGRPEIDRVFAELVAGEVCDRIAAVGSGTFLVFAGREPIGSFYTIEARLRGEPVVDSFARQFVVDTVTDPVGVALRGNDRGSLNLVAVRNPARDPSALLVVTLKDDDPLTPAVIEETRLRLDAAR